MLKIAIVYDWIDKWGGVERVLLELSKLFPQADFYTSYYDEKKASWAKNLNIKTSFIQKLPKFIRRRRTLSLPFYPFAFESFNFNSYNLVISVSSSFAKSVITKPGTLHICYLLTPTRFLWLYPELYLSRLIQRIGSWYFNYLRKWDFVAGQRPDRIIAISKTVADRCKKYYKREAEVLYPPFDKYYWERVQHSKFNLKRLTFKYYLIVSRLEPYKKVDLAVNVFNKRKDLNLIIVGEGTEKEKLKQIAGENIKFLGKATNEELAKLYSEAEALIMPQEEDFGYVALEAQFFGCPVIAFKKGGAVETVSEGKTGIFFDHQNEKSLSQALERFKTMSYNLRYQTVKTGRENTENFATSIFKKRFLDFLKNAKS
ncbi:MAG: glycosyltransferase [Microgenomates group bacterium]|nr:glycosyltransferase [Microgenomates group bacterium]